MATYQASLLIFSGRPDPAWEIPANVAAELLNHWQQLPPLTKKPTPPARLGYRGCLLFSSAGEEWNAFEGAVIRKTEGSSEVRYDQERIFEKMLINSAPPGMIPVGIIF